MPLTIGSRVGPYEITGPIGQGGMGFFDQSDGIGRDDQRGAPFGGCQISKGERD